MSKLNTSVRRNLRSGFTLLELVVVVIIIGILAAIASLAYNQIIKSAHDGAATANAKVLSDSLSVGSSKENVTVVALLGDATTLAKFTPSGITNVTGAVVPAVGTVAAHYEVSFSSGDGGKVYYCGDTAPGVGAVGTTVACS